jgi:hypothetical protein
MQRHLAFGACVIAVAALVYGTLAPIWLPYAIYLKLAPWLGDPSVELFVVIERVVAYAMFGALLSYAFPDRILYVCCVIILSAGILEYLQTITPDRHGHVLEACEKMAGGLFGACADFTISRRRRRGSATRPPPPNA